MEIQQFRALFAVFGCVCLPACGGSLPVPASTTHPRATFVEVPYPPPAALAETITQEPEDPDAVWVDGEWVYRGRDFVWQRGGWVKAPEGARFAPWRLRYLRDGRLLMASGTWYDPAGRRLERVTTLRPAATPPNELTSESQSGR